MGDLRVARLVQLADTTTVKAQTMATQSGCEPATDGWRDLLDDPDIDVIPIAVPKGLHREMAAAALQAGKHVWCEKLMALTLEVARAMETVARTSGRKTQLG